jgi:nitrogen fixation protein NifU and related proteins
MQREASSMNTLEALYRDVILDHNRQPRNFRRLAVPCDCIDGVNALCGDRLRVCVKLAGERVTEVAFEGSGCAISVASASMMTEAVAGGTRQQALALAADISALLAGERDRVEPAQLSALAAVRAFPSRVRCATLGWQALRAALSGETATVTTETTDTNDHRHSA